MIVSSFPCCGVREARGAARRRAGAQVSKRRGKGRLSICDWRDQAPATCPVRGVAVACVGSSFLPSDILGSSFLPSVFRHPSSVPRDHAMRRESAVVTLIESLDTRKRAYGLRSVGSGSALALSRTSATAHPKQSQVRAQSSGQTSSFVQSRPVSHAAHAPSPLPHRSAERRRVGARRHRRGD